MADDVRVSSRGGAESGIRWRAGMDIQLQDTRDLGKGLGILMGAVIARDDAFRLRPLHVGAPVGDDTVG